MRTGDGRNAAALTQRCAGAIFLVSIFVALVASGQTTTFSDSVFDSANWFVDTRYAGGAGTASGAPQTSGGNPGSYFRLTIQTTPGPSGLLAFVRNPNFTYNPSAQGAINAVAISLNLESQAGFGTAFVNLAMEQNFQIYVGPEYDTTATNWVSFRDSLTASSFNRVISPGNGEFSLDTSSHPDFSMNGAGMSFGFSSILNADPGATAASETMGIDNYNVVLNLVAVPEPTAMVLLAGGLGTLAVMRRRRKLIISRFRATRA